MNFHQIKKLIDLLQNTNIAKIEIQTGDESIRIIKNKVTPSKAVFAKHATKELDTTTDDEKNKQHVLVEPEHHIIRAPMVGNVHLTQSPKTKPFVMVGQIVKVGDIVCFIKSMNTFHEVKADKPGKIVARLVTDGQSVEYHQPLFTVE